MPESRLTIFAVSDATGELAISIATAALRQFDRENVAILRRARVQTLDKIARVVREVREAGGLIAFTFVSPELRHAILQMAGEAGVPAVDLMGPMMENLSRYFRMSPSDEPGLKYHISGDYFRRNEAIEFSVKHDDGLGMETILQAEIVLLGISRTSKTPLSIYLAYRGFKTANVPIVPDVPLPEALFSVDRKRVIGLTIEAEKLLDLRAARLAKMRRPPSENYANLDEIRREIMYAQKLFATLGSPVINVTSKAVEEIASEILTILGR